MFHRAGSRSPAPGPPGPQLYTMYVLFRTNVLAQIYPFRPSSRIKHCGRQRRLGHVMRPQVVHLRIYQPRQPPMAEPRGVGGNRSQFISRSMRGKRMHTCTAFVRLIVRLNTITPSSLHPREILQHRRISNTTKAHDRVLSFAGKGPIRSACCAPSTANDCFCTRIFNMYLYFPRGICRRETTLASHLLGILCRSSLVLTVSFLLPLSAPSLGPQDQHHGAPGVPPGTQQTDPNITTSMHG